MIYIFFLSDTKIIAGGSNGTGEYGVRTYQ